MSRRILTNDNYEDAPYKPDDPFFYDDEEDYEADIQDNTRMSIEQLKEIRKNMLAFTNDMLRKVEKIDGSLRDILAIFDT